MGVNPPFLARLAKSALDLVFPIHCCACGREGEIICPECSHALPTLSPPYCQVCAAPNVGGFCRWCLSDPKAFDSLRAPFLFEGAVRDAIHALKYRGVRVASGPLARLMVEYLERNPVQADLLVPAPLHPRRLRSRGYNQSQLLAERIAKALDLPVRNDLLSRTANPLPQVETQSRDQRRANVIGSFACQGDVQGLTLLLIDDVATTGSTLSECASVLKAAGALRVHTLTLAREA